MPKFYLCATCRYFEPYIIGPSRPQCISCRKTYAWEAPSFYKARPKGPVPKEEASSPELPKRIVLIGEMGAGKDTVAELLKDHKRLAFGDLIKDIARYIRLTALCLAEGMLKALFNEEPPVDLYRRIKDFHSIPVVGPKDRTLLQELGTYCRLHKDNIWTAPVLDTLKDDQKYVITDCRRQSEFDACIAKGFIPIAVMGFEDIRKERLVARDKKISLEEMSHVAEREIQQLIPQCKHFIYNNGTKKDLELELKQLLGEREEEKIHEADF